MTFQYTLSNLIKIDDSKSIDLPHSHVRDAEEIPLSVLASIQVWS